MNEIEYERFFSFNKLNSKYKIELTKAIVDAIGADKVCIAGSVGNEERMNQMKDAGVAEYTMGSALFNANFVEGGTFRENLEYVLNYLRK